MIRERKTHRLERLDLIISDCTLPKHPVPEKVGESQVDVGLQQQSISMKREDGLGQDQVSLRIFEDDGEGFEGHREMIKDVDRCSLVVEEILGHREGMRVPGLVFGVKR